MITACLKPRGLKPGVRAWSSGAHVRSFGALVLILLAGSLLLPAGAGAQSLMNAGGLGLLNDPLDARSRALGSVGIGLEGWYMLATDPSAAAGLNLPSVTGTFQPSTSRVDGGARAGGTRFPTLGVSYPFGRHVFVLQFGSFLDQEWEVRTERTLNLSGQEVEAVDQFESVGGIGQARLGWATRVGEDLAVGLNVGSYTGAMERRFVRQLDPGTVGAGVEPFLNQGRWRASGLTVAAGATWQPSALVRVAASVEQAGDLTLDPVTPTPGPEKSYPMPLTLRAGGTVTLASDLRLSTGFARADWSGVDEALGGDAARDVAWGYGGGVEWVGSTILGRTAPIRLGYRHQDLPFHFQGEPATESAFSAGLSVNLADTETMPVARIEYSLERGTRDAGVFSEEYWRSTLSIRLAGG